MTYARSPAPPSSPRRRGSGVGVSPQLVPLRRQLVGVRPQGRQGALSPGPLRVRLPGPGRRHRPPRRCRQRGWAPRLRFRRCLARPRRFPPLGRPPLGLRLAVRRPPAPPLLGWSQVGRPPPERPPRSPVSPISGRPGTRSRSRIQGRIQDRPGRRNRMWSRPGRRSPDRPRRRRVRGFRLRPRRSPPRPLPGRRSRQPPSRAVRSLRVPA
jgi:hypothetical protein